MRSLRGIALIKIIKINNNKIGDNMDFTKYILAAKKVYKFRIKSLVELTDDIMSDIEKVLFKYRPESISSPKKTMFQTNPLGFSGTTSGEVWIVDIELTIGTTSTMLEYDLRNHLHIGKFDDRIKVFGENDPVENEIDKLEKEEEEKTPVLLTNENFEEVDEPKFCDYFGDDYNSKFLDIVKKYEEDRKKRTKAGFVGDNK